MSHHWIFGVIFLVILKFSYGHSAANDNDLPCCPATCPQCLPEAERPRRRFKKPSDDSFVDVPMRRRKPGYALQKAGQLLDDGPEAGYELEQGQLRPVVLLENADFFRQDLWRPTGLPGSGRRECKDSSCPCFGCKCCFTELYLCTVTEKCVATVLETVTRLRTVTTTILSRAMVSVTASITFTGTNEVVFRSTETFTEFFETAATFTDAVFVITVTSEFPIYRSTTTFQASFGTSTIFASDSSITITEFEPGDLTITVSQGVASVFDGFVYEEISVLQTSTIPSLVPFTVPGPYPTITSDVPLTLKKTPTLSPIPLTLTPTIIVATVSTTETITDTRTRTEKDCTGVDTIRIQATKTILRSIGTIIPSPVTCCPGKQPFCRQRDHL